jgi:hypothetical protein
MNSLRCSAICYVRSDASGTLPADGFANPAINAQNYRLRKSLGAAYDGLVIKHKVCKRGAGCDG